MLQREREYALNYKENIILIKYIYTFLTNCHYHENIECI